MLTSRRLPTIAQTRPRTGGRRLGDEQPADQPGEHPDDQQLIAQQFIDQLDEPPSLATTTKGWGASPSSSSAHAATSRLASARLRPRVVEKEVVEKEKEKEKEVLPEPDITITENDDPTQRGATIVSPPRPVAPTDVQPTDVQPTGVQPTGAEPTDAEKRAKVLDVQAQIKRLNALLLDLTGGSADQ